VARLLVEHGVSGVPVVDEYGCLCGVVSESDILEKERVRERRRFDFIRRFVSPRQRRAAAKRDAWTAGGAMTTPAVTISRFTSVGEAASTMAERGVDRLVITERSLRDSTENVLGIVTRGDLVRAFARTDDEIANEIRHLLEYDFGLWPGQVRVTVHQGVVTVEGTVGLRSTAEDIEAMVAQVPGVLALRPKLGWRMEAASTQGPAF
jgi:CBS domain-containing protein